MTKGIYILLTIVRGYICPFSLKRIWSLLHHLGVNVCDNVIQGLDRTVITYLREVVTISM